MFSNHLKKLVWATLSLTFLCSIVFSAIPVGAAPVSSGIAKYLDPTNIEIEFPALGIKTTLRKDGLQFKGSVIANDGRQCGVSISGLPFGAQLTLTVKGAESSSLGSSGSTVYPACGLGATLQFPSTASLSEAENNTNPPAESADTKIIAAVVIIPNNGGLTDAGSDFVDETLAPETDTIELRGEDGSTVLQTTSSNREKSFADVVYRANFGDINPGTYQVCSVAIAKRCETFVKEYGKLLNAAITANADEFDIVKETSSASGVDPDSCESQTGLTAFFMCPMISMISSGLQWLDKQMSRLLTIDSDKYASGPTSDAMYKTWSNFRNIGLSLLIAAMLVMVISTALGVGMLDAYTVKKSFPRMVLAVIFMMLSWWVCIFLINASNTVGKGVLGLMTSPFNGSASTLASLFSVDAAGAGAQIGGTIIAVGSLFLIPGAAGLLLSWLGTGMLIMGIAFLVLIARQMFIIVLILGAPIAILSWIFPGNDKLWKVWWQSFSKLLIMFPMVMALVASGRIFAGVINDLNSSGGEDLLNTLMKFTAYVVPYGFIPLTFKAAGGVFGNLVGMANDRSRGAFDRLKKGRQKTMGEIGQRMAAGQGFRGGTNTLLNRSSSGLASGPRGWFNSETRRGIRESRLAELGEAANKENRIHQANKNNDMYLLARASEQMAQDKIDEADRKAQSASTAAERTKYEQEAAARRRALGMARATPNNAATRRQAALELAATGYQFAQGQEGYNELSRISREINGTDAAAHADFMNTAQYALKSASRFDLGGINNGVGYDPEKGIEKASLYELANAKGESIKAMVDSIPTGPAGHEAAVAYTELESMRSNAKGGTLKAIDEAMRDLEARGVGAYASTPSGNTDSAGNPARISERKDFDSARAAADPIYAASWSPDEQARGWRAESRLETKMDVARAAARPYIPPDPNNRT